MDISDNIMEINIEAETTQGVVEKIQQQIGGTLTERWGEHVLIVDNDIAKGNIRYINFEWGVDLLQYDITFFKDVVTVTDASLFNPLKFIYCLQGHIGHRFGIENALNKIEQFQSVITTNKDGGTSYSYLPKDVKLEINVIQITRKKFLKKRLNDVSLLNNRLHEVFIDTDHENRFRFFGSVDLKLADAISAIKNVKQKGMIRTLLIEGLVYQVLSMHILNHKREENDNMPNTSLLKRELKQIRKIAKKIQKDVSLPYNLEQLSEEYGLSQAKLQEGFKLLYTRTVTEYIRHARLEAARDLLRNSDMNVSEVVYTIGFSSRSYFSKIFKNKYHISPSEFKHKIENTNSIETLKI